MTANRSAPTATVVPVLIYEDVGQAIDYALRSQTLDIAQDHAGHWWTFSQHVSDVPPEEWGAISARGK